MHHDSTPHANRGEAAMTASRAATAILILAVALPSSTVLAGSEAADKRAILLPGASVDLPYSHAVWTGDFLYTAGALGRVPGEGYPDGIEAQTRQTFANLERVLEAAGSDLSRVVSLSVFLADDRHYDAMNAVFREVFSDNAPTRTTVRTDLAATAGLIEMSMVAVREGVELRRIMPDGWRPSGAGYAYGILAGDTLFVSGAVSNDPASGAIVAGDVGLQTKRTFANIGRVLEAAGMSYDDIAANRVYLRDARHFDDMNAAYRPVFGEEPPARATMRAGMMHPDLLVEIQSVAVKDAGRRIAGNANPASPFSPSIVAGGRQFLQGMTGWDESGYPPGDVKAQTRMTIEKIEATLAAAGLGLEDIVDSAVYLSDIRYFAAMNEVYRELIPAPRPSRTTVEAVLMGPEALVEIMVVADAGGATSR